MACQSLGFSAIEAKIAGPKMAVLECAKIAIADNSFERNLNLVELSRALNLLNNTLDDRTVFYDTARTLGLPDNNSVIEKIMKIKQLPWIVQEGIINGAISLPVAIDLGDLDKESSEFLTKLFNDLHLSLNKQRELLVLIREISLRDNISIKNLFEEEEIRIILKDDLLDCPQIAGRLRVQLRKRRFPAIADAEEKFEEYVRSLKLKGKVKIIPPMNFEGSVYNIQLAFGSLDDLKSCRECLDKIINHPQTRIFLEG
jgi:ParB family chromosome partitioning protein